MYSLNIESQEVEDSLTAAESSTTGSAIEPTEVALLISHNSNALQRPFHFSKLPGTFRFEKDYRRHSAIGTLESFFAAEVWVYHHGHRHTGF